MDIPLLHLSYAQFEQLNQIGRLELEHSTFHALRFSSQVAITDPNGYNAIVCNITVTGAEVGEYRGQRLYSMILEVSK